MSNLIIFTDLDGTLLNHKTYDYERVCPLLEKLKALGIPVVLNSSKTLSELDAWQSQLKLLPPVIAENGGVMRVPEVDSSGTQKVLIGRPYAEIRSHLIHIREVHGWAFEGFGDWTVSDVMNHTGLPSDQAVLSMEREVTEPILWQDTPENFEAFKVLLEEEQLMVKKGGRFLHVMGKHDKSDAMHFLVNKEYFSCGLGCTTVALGDSDNDIAMLNYADIAIVIPPEIGDPLHIKGAIYVDDHAPSGWIKGVESVLKDLQTK